MRKRLPIACLLLVGLLFMGAPVSAEPLDVPADLIVIAGGLEWAWASPCSPVDPSCGTPLVMHHGFRIAEEADYLASFSSMLDIYNAFNPVGGAQICASAYFNSGYSHCDNANIYPPNAGYEIGAWNAPANWGSQQLSFAEAFVVRGSVPDAGSSMLLLGLGLVGLRAWRKR